MSTHWGTARVREEASPTDPKLRDLHDTGQQQDIQEESPWGYSTDSISEAGGLELHQSLLEMIIWN